MITPAEIATKAKNAYEKRFLPLWIRGNAAAFFPLRIPANLKLNAEDIAGTIGAVDKLRNGSKESRGRGYTVHWEEVNLRDFGRNQKPQLITIDFGTPRTAGTSFVTGVVYDDVNGNSLYDAGEGRSAVTGR